MVEIATRVVPVFGLAHGLNANSLKAVIWVFGSVLLAQTSVQKLTADFKKFGTIQRSHGTGMNLM